MFRLSKFNSRVVGIKAGGFEKVNSWEGLIIGYSRVCMGLLRGCKKRIECHYFHNVAFLLSIYFKGLQVKLKEGKGGIYIIKDPL